MTPTDPRIIQVLEHISYALDHLGKIAEDIVDIHDYRLVQIQQSNGFIDQLLVALQTPDPLSLPSRTDKAATAPAGDANQAAPEFASHSVGDYVQFTINAAGDKRTGFIRHISGDGMATIIEDVTRLLHFKDLCALKNLSRQEGGAK